jgi:hypothetical protein
MLSRANDPVDPVKVLAKDPVKVPVKVPVKSETARENGAGGAGGRKSMDGQSGKPALYQAPEMIIRVYHDAKTAEVTSYQNHKFFKAVYPVPNQFMYHSDEKEQLNLFLAEWLNLCINEGMCNPDELHLEYLSCN